MNDVSNSPRDETFDGRALVAGFADRARAQEAVDALKAEHFHRIWLGVTSSQGTVQPASGDTLGEKIGRFFSGGVDDTPGRTLAETLVAHGVDAAQAQRIDGSIEPKSVLLTVDGANHPELAAEIIEECGGHVLAGEAFAGGSDALDDDERMLGSRHLGYGAGDEFARGQRIDEDRRIALRAERLTIDKERVSAGEAVVRKDVVEQHQSVDVPVMREEFFIERHAVADTAVSDSVDPIGEGETIRIPLTREEIRVTKRPVVTEEVMVGKRGIAETRNVDETVREERLVVDDRDGGTRDRAR